jgi:hypothetical protein
LPVATSWLPPFCPDWQADRWIAIVLGAVTGITIVEDCLLEYRLHDFNGVGLREKLPLAERVSHERVARFLSRADLLDAAIARVSDLARGVPSPADRAIFRAQIAHLRIRGSLPMRAPGACY